jgi:hypothetical protein
MLMDPPRSTGQEVLFMDPDVRRDILLGKVTGLPFDLICVREYAMNNTIEVSRDDLELIRDALDSASVDDVPNVESILNALTVTQVYLDNMEFIGNGNDAEWPAEVSGGEAAESAEAEESA